MAGPHPVLAAQLFQSLHVFPGVFQLPEQVRAQVPCDYGAACVRSLQLAAPLLEAFAPLVRSWPALLDRNLRKGDEQRIQAFEPRRRQQSSAGAVTWRRCCCRCGRCSSL